MADPKRRPRKLWPRLVTSLLLAAGAWLVGLIWFAASLPRGPEDETTPSDAIVVLTGGAGRLDEGLALLRAGLGQKLFVSGVYRGVDVDQLLHLSQETPENLSCCIVIGYEADDTIGNAVETARWMAQENYTSLRLVTATYHIPRALLAFRRHLPGVTIIAHPIVPQSFHQTDWWKWRGSAFLMLREYNKFIFAWTRAILDRPQNPPAGASPS